MQKWYIVQGGNREGPYSVEQVQQMSLTKPIASDTLVWSEGMESWAPLSSTPLSSTLSNSIAPPSLPMSVALQGATGAAIGFLDAIKICFAKYATFEGRASRPEYWWFFLFVLLCAFVMWIPFIGWALALALIIPSIAVAVRRLHDTDRTGWWYLISFVPIIGFIVIIIFLAQKGTDGKNRYG